MRTSLIAVLLVSAAVLSCRSEEDSGRPSISVAERGHIDSVKAVMEAFLEQSRLTNTQHVADTVFACDIPGMTDRRLGLAEWRVLGIEANADSARVAVETISVAEEHGSQEVADTNVATVGIRTDTLRWKLRRNDGRWGICGYSMEGVDFMWGGTDVRRSWMPAGASLDRAKALADSIRTTESGRR